MWEVSASADDYQDPYRMIGNPWYASEHRNRHDILWFKID